MDFPTPWDWHNMTGAPSKAESRKEMFEAGEDPEEKLCAYCDRPVRGRWATFSLPDGNVVYSHGKCRWFPELWRKLNVYGLKYESRQGKDGEVIIFLEDYKR